MSLFAHYRSLLLRLPAALFCVLMLSALPAAGQSAGEDPFSLMRGTQEPGVKRTVAFEARLTKDGAVMREGLTWRVFKSVPDSNGRLELVASAEGGSKAIELPAKSREFAVVGVSLMTDAGALRTVLNGRRKCGGGHSISFPARTLVFRPAPPKAVAEADAA